MGRLNPGTEVFLFNLHSLDLKLRAEEFIDVHVDCNKVLTRPNIGTWAKNSVNCTGLEKIKYTWRGKCLWRNIETIYT